MKVPARAVLAAAMVAAVTVLAHAAPTGEEILRRSQQAELKHSYRGAQISLMFFPRHSITAVAEVIHRAPSTTRVEYRSPPSLLGTVELQIGRDRWRRSPRDGRWQRATEAPTPETLDLLTQNYRIRLGPGTPIANRRCSLLLITPRRLGNPSKRMWVDEATGLVLRTELLNWKQENISISTFRQIEIDPDLSDYAAVLAPPRQFDSSPAAALAFRPSSPRYVPKGYRFIGTSAVTFGQYSAAHLRYTDGLNTISLFQAPAAAFTQQTPLGSLGLSFTQVIMWRRGDNAFAIMGDIDPAELRRMAESAAAIAPTRGR